MAKNRSERNDDQRHYARARLYKKYGISEIIYIEMLIKQDYRCAVCRGFDSNNKRMVVDHCHVSGKVRGLLCSPCNMGIGSLKDSVLLLERALAYLKREE